MSRFNGWKGYNIENLMNKKSEEAKPKKKKAIPDYPQMIVDELERLGILGVVKEYRFLKDRRFKFDGAIPEHKIAFEFEGGIYSKFSRHTQGKGYATDCKKYNLAVMHGWKLLRYTTADLKNKRWAEESAKEISTLIEG